MQDGTTTVQDALATATSGDLRRDHALEQGTHALRALRVMALLAMPSLALVAWRDVEWLGLEALLPLRLGALAALALAGILAWTVLPRRPQWATWTHAAALAALMTHVVLVTAWLMAVRPRAEAWQSGVTTGLLVSEMVVFAFASGARRHVPWILLGPLGGLVAGMVLLARLKPAEASLLVDPVLGALGLSAMAFLQDRMAFREFVTRRLAADRLSRIERQAGELQAARDGLEQRVADRTEAMQKANEALRTDIERREAVESALRQSEERYRSLVQDAPVGIAVLGAAPLRVLLANAALERLLGRGEDELKALDRGGLEALVAPADREDAFRRLAERLEGGGDTKPNRMGIVRADGQVRRVDVTAAPIRGPGEPAVHLVFVEAAGRDPG